MVSVLAGGVGRAGALGNSTREITEWASQQEFGTVEWANIEDRRYGTMRLSR